MEQTFKQMVEVYLANRKQLSFVLDEIEQYILKEVKSMNAYIDRGGTYQLKQDILSIQKEGKISPIKAKEKELHRGLHLPKHWRKNKETVEEKWARSYVLSKMTKLDLLYFVNNPEAQTLKNKERIDTLFSFLETRDSREVITAEERMYELFHKEKWLHPEPDGENGQWFLSKLKLDMEDLKAKRFPEPIPYETRNRIPLAEVETVLITENNSFYHSVRRCLEFQKNIVDIPVDMIVYARGKQTIANLEYLYTLFKDATEKKYYYIGDIDPEGFSIYANVKRKYADLPIELAKGIYIRMLQEEHNPPKVGKKQLKNKDDFELFLTYFNESNDDFYRKKLESLWNENKRIPQEVLNYEKLTRKKGKEC